MKATEMVDKIKDLLGIELSSQDVEAVELAQSTLENGTVIEYESMEAGSPVFIVSEDEKIALPAGEYTLEDGKMLVVIDEGEISEIKEAAEKEEEAEEEVEAADHKEEEEMQYVKKEEFQAAVEDMSVLQADMEKQNETKEKEELAKIEVEAEPVYHSPEKTKKPVLNLSQNRPLTTQDIVFKKLYS
jgi:hypothetical protein